MVLIFTSNFIWYLGFCVDNYLEQELVVFQLATYSTKF
jgi:hypothetical protein